jgi:hypothetical protein
VNLSAARNCFPGTRGRAYLDAACVSLMPVQADDSITRQQAQQAMPLLRKQPDCLRRRTSEATAKEKNVNAVLWSRLAAGRATQSEIDHFEEYLDWEPGRSSRERSPHTSYHIRSRT